MLADQRFRFSLIDACEPHQVVEQIGTGVPGLTQLVEDECPPAFSELELGRDVRRVIPVAAASQSARSRFAITRI